jgi:uncharacterized protein DUF6585
MTGSDGTVPLGVAALGHEYGLGRHTARYAIARPGPGVRVAVGTAVAVVLVGAVGTGWWGVGIVAGLGAVVYLVLRYAMRGRPRDRLRFHLFEQGFVQEDPATARLDAYRWDRIAAVHRKVVSRYRVGSAGTPPRTTYLYRVCRDDGTGTTFGVRTGLAGAVPDVVEFGELVQREVAARALPPAYAALERGETVQLGDFALSPAELRGRTHGWSLPWHEIARVRVSNGTVEVLKHGLRLPVASITADAVPNLPVFLALAEHLRQAAQPATQ